MLFLNKHNRSKALLIYTAFCSHFPINFVTLNFFLRTTQIKSSNLFEIGGQMCEGSAIGDAMLTSIYTDNRWQPLPLCFYLAGFLIYLLQVFRTLNRFWSLKLTKTYVHVRWLGCLLERPRMFRKPIAERSRQALATGHLLVKPSQGEMAAFYLCCCVSIIQPLFYLYLSLDDSSYPQSPPPQAWWWSQMSPDPGHILRWMRGQGRSGSHPELNPVHLNTARHKHLSPYAEAG